MKADFTPLEVEDAIDSLRDRYENGELRWSIDDEPSVDWVMLYWWGMIGAWIGQERALNRLWGLYQPRTFREVDGQFVEIAGERFYEIGQRSIR